MNMLLIICVLLGVVVRHIGRYPEALVSSLNWWLLTIALPALTLTLVPKIDLSHQVLFPIVGMWLVFLGAGVVALVAGARWHWSHQTIGAVALLAGIGNTSFIGFPMVSEFYGVQGLSFAVLADQLGSFLVLSTLGSITIAVCVAEAQVRAKQVLKQLIRFPPFLALLLGLVLNPLGGLPDFLAPPVAQIGATMTPLALFSIGLQIRLRAMQGASRPLAVALGWKLIVAPLMILVLAWGLGISPIVAQVTVVQAGMAPMIAAMIMLQHYQFVPTLVSSILSYGIVLSFVSLWGWRVVLGYVY